MRLVDRALIKPARCAVNPALGGNHPRGYIDTGSEMPGKGDQWDFHIYCSVVMVEEMARFLGGGSAEDIAALNERIETLEAELEMARDELSRTELVLDSIDVLEGADFRARRKTGRPKTKSEVGV